MKEITYIIGYKHDSERFQNLRKVLRHLHSIPEVKVLIIEVGKHSQISHLNLGVEVKFVESNVDFYNRSWVFNVGLSFVKTKKIAFGDSDIIMPIDQFRESISMLETYDILSPYKSIINLTEIEATLKFEDIFKIKRAGRGVNDTHRLNISGGVLFANRDSFLKIGGWCELFEGWGAEDDALTHVIEHKLKWTEMPYTAFHLYHTPCIPQIDLYTNNLNLLAKIKSFHGKYLDKFISDNGANNGKLNKYLRGR